MKNINLLILGFTIALSASAQNTVLISKNTGNKISSLSEPNQELAMNEEINANKDFKSYVNTMKDLIAKNENNISSIKYNFPRIEMKSRKKLENILVELQNENGELRTELSTYIKYGVGDWKLFKKDFNQEIFPVVQDLSYLVNKFVSEDQLISEAK